MQAAKGLTSSVQGLLHGCVASSVAPGPEMADDTNCLPRTTKPPRSIDKSKSLGHRVLSSTGLRAAVGTVDEPRRGKGGKDAHTARTHYLKVPSAVKWNEAPATSP